MRSRPGCMGERGTHGPTSRTGSRTAHPHDLAGHADSAIALYQRYLGRASQLDVRLLWLDPAHLAETFEALGRNYENRAQPDSAANYYQALLDLWKNADPMLEPKKQSLAGDAGAHDGGEGLPGAAPKRDRRELTQVTPPSIVRPSVVRCTSPRSAPPL